MSKDTGNPNWETAQMIREYQSKLEFNPLMDGASIDDHQITVCVRKRLQRGQSERPRCDLMNKDPGNPNCETVLMIREYQSTLEFNMLMDGASIDDDQITLCWQVTAE